MVLKEWGEVRRLYKATASRIRKAPFALSKIRCYWYVWVSVVAFLASIGFYVYIIVKNPQQPALQIFLALAPGVLTEVLLLYLMHIARVREFQFEYDTHGITQLPRRKQKEYLHYALFLRGLFEQGYTATTLEKIKGFVLVAEPPTPPTRLLQNPVMVPILTIGTVLGGCVAMERKPGMFL